MSYSDERNINYADDTKSKNIRVSYPLDYMHNSIDQPVNDHAKNIFLLTCDMYGFLPVLAKLSPEQVLYYFLSGYTCKSEEG